MESGDMNSSLHAWREISLTLWTLSPAWSKHILNKSIKPLPQTWVDPIELTPRELCALKPWYQQEKMSPESNRNSQYLGIIYCHSCKHEETQVCKYQATQKRNMDQISIGQLEKEGCPERLMVSLFYLCPNLHKSIYPVLPVAGMQTLSLELS